MALKLPGFSWSPLKHIGDKSHKVRFVLKDVGTGEVFLVVMATLLAGEDLRAAVEADRGAGRGAGNSAGADAGIQGSGPAVGSGQGAR